MEHYKTDEGVVFGDVNLREGRVTQIRDGTPQNPGAGGWPTLRYYNADTGPGGAPAAGGARPVARLVREQLSPLEWVELSSMVFGDSADGGDASLLRKDMQPKWSATKAGWKDNKLRPNRPAPAPE